MGVDVREGIGGEMEGRERRTRMEIWKKKNKSSRKESQTEIREGNSDRKEGRKERKQPE